MNALRSTCPTGCGRSVDSGKLTCRPCWSKVPKDLQSRVYVTWRTWRKNFGDADAMDGYKDAVENALAAIA